MAVTLDVSWIQIDMSTQKQKEAGIYDRLSRRRDIYNEEGNFRPREPYFSREDGIREEHWLNRIEERAQEGRVLVVCGNYHKNPFAEKAERHGHTVIRKLSYPQNLQEPPIE